MSESKTRVDFNAPESLVERAVAIADILDISRIQLIIGALSEKMGDVTTDDDVRRRIADAYYAGRLEFGTLESLLGTEAAMRMQLLRASLDREPPEPQVTAYLPSDEAFYEGEPPEWTPTESTDPDPPRVPPAPERL